MGTPTNVREAALKEMAIREMERRTEPQRRSLIEFIKYYFKHEMNKEFDDNRHYKLIEKKLLEVMEGKCIRLIINVPPGSGKTLLITKFFPVWYLGHKQDLHIIATGYSANLTQNFSGEARDIYQSETYRRVFPRATKLREDQNTKEFWQNTDGGRYYATGTGGTITGVRANLFLCDDPIKPDDADSDIKRTGINNWYENTVLSRLFDPIHDAVIIIMQRTHDNDLCGFLMDKENEGLGEKWDKIILPAIAEEDEEYRKQGEALQENRYPLESLAKLKQSLGINFATQYQQQPTNAETMEFFPERFRYYGEGTGIEMPNVGRVFTAVDPAFSKKEQADNSAIFTVKFVDEKLYILEYTVGKFDPSELIDKIIYHIKKREPEKVGIEAVQAQIMINFSLKLELQKRGLYTQIEEIKSRTEKETRIRRLIPLYRNGLIFHKLGMDELEHELKRFPKGKRDDCPDALCMTYDLYTLQPSSQGYSKQKVRIEYDKFGHPHILGTY